MKHTYKIYYFLLLGLFLVKIPHTMLGAYITDSKKNIAYISISQHIDMYAKDTVITEFMAAHQEEPNEPKVNLVPNPSYGEIKLKVKEDLWYGGTVSIYNIIGQLVAQKPIDDDEIDFDLTDRSQGVYLVTLRKGDIQKTLRMVKN